MEDDEPQFLPVDSVDPVAIEEAGYDAGYRMGYDEGHAKGFDEGYREWRGDLLERLRAMQPEDGSWGGCIAALEVMP